MLGIFTEYDDIMCCNFYLVLSMRTESVNVLSVHNKAVLVLDLRTIWSQIMYYSLTHLLSLCDKAYITGNGIQINFSLIGGYKMFAVYRRNIMRSIYTVALLSGFGTLHSPPRDLGPGCSYGPPSVQTVRDHVRILRGTRKRNLIKADKHDC